MTWSTVSQAEPRSAIVSEGLTVEAIPYARCLLSFGGYNGKYQSTLQILKPGESIQADWHATVVLHFVSAYRIHSQTSVLA